jgi:SAM-dependent methyltransferase
MQVPSASTPTERAEKDDQWERILGSILGNHAAWIIDIGLRAGLISAIGDRDGVTTDELASSLGFDPSATGAWARAAFAYSILDWSEEHGYRLPASLYAILLDPTDPQYLGGRVQFYTALYEDFKVFPAFLKSGELWPRSAHDPWLLVALANLSKPDGVMITSHALPAVPKAEAALRQGGALLDIGSGAGRHLIHYATAYPTARIVGLEPDDSSNDLARHEIMGAGLGERVSVETRDANDLDAREMFDVVILNITLHETGGPADWANILRRVAVALRPGGSVVVSELPYPDSIADYRSDAVYRMLAGVQLHETVVGCGAITKGRLVELLREAGFADVRVVDQPMKTRYVVVGERPSGPGGQGGR